MNTPSFHCPSSPFRVCLLALALAGATSVMQAAEQTQTLNLATGWNSVWLEVQPTVASGDEAGLSMRVEDVFSNPAVTVVARPEVPVGSAEFISNSQAGSFNQDGWSVWHRTPESTVNTLVRVHGNRGYLIKCSADVSIDVAGAVRFFRPTWVPASYNLVGFGLSAPVTFAQFFGPSGGVHPSNAIFRLQGDRWIGVSPTGLMDPGEAYWVFAERNSDYAGPVAVRIEGTTGLQFGDGPGSIEPTGLGFPLNLREVTFTNLDGANAHEITLQKILPATTGGGALGDDLRLYELVPDLTNLSYAVGGSGQLTTWTLSPALPGGTSRTITVGANHNWASGEAERTNLYQIQVAVGSSGAKQTIWLPASAGNADLATAGSGDTDARSAGLWLGEVTVQEVTSLTESGNPVAATASPLPIQLIIHADANGTPSLLGHALLMQTKVADDETIPEDVIVVDEAKIPFFEGIEVRRGKRIGRRFETIAYDLPRDVDPALQSTAFLTEIAAAEGLLDGSNAPDPTQVAAIDISSFVEAAASRPPGLTDSYHLSWPLEGGLAAGSTLQTGSTPLVLDPFHRSNPFRHAFHPQHGKGRAITRSMTLTFEDVYEPGRLQGSYEETITGLTATPLTVRGIVTLERISEAVELQ